MTPGWFYKSPGTAPSPKRQGHPPWRQEHNNPPQSPRPQGHTTVPVTFWSHLQIWHWLPVQLWETSEIFSTRICRLNSLLIKFVKQTFYHLWNIPKIRSILSQCDAEKQFHTFVISRLDYCNVLLEGCRSKSLNSLQLIPNAATWVLTGISRRDHTYSSLAFQKVWIKFKILLLTYKTLSSQAPHYLQDPIRAYAPIRALRVQLNSAVAPAVQEQWLFNWDNKRLEK